MRKKVGNTTSKASRKCIFCGNGKLSKEHIWPAWAAPLLPKLPDPKRSAVLFTFTEKHHMVRPPEEETRAGHLWSKKIRAVCTRCNNGWMSKLETDAKPVLVPLIRSKQHVLSTESMKTLVQWITLKVMVGEQDHPEYSVTQQTDRTAFMKKFQIPVDYRIWIGKCGEGIWETEYIRHSATMSRTPIVTPDHRFRNIHSIAIGIGDLFIFVLHTTVSDILNKIPMHSEAIVQLLPLGNSINWPPKRNLTPNNAHSVANTLTKMIKSPSVKWAPGFPYNKP